MPVRLPEGLAQGCLPVFCSSFAFLEGALEVLLVTCLETLKPPSLFADTLFQLKVCTE